MTRIIFYRETDGSVPLLEWLDTLPPRAQAKCGVRLERLRDVGHELRRPEADYLRDEIYELRVTLSGINYRMLYFFHGTAAVVLSHGIIKQRTVPAREINRAMVRKRDFTAAPKRHIYEEG